ncbi:MAG: hypothetical protein WEG56_03330 [Chloroflexota bacterium]
MTSATGRRLAKLEVTLHPREAVLHWLAEAQGYPGIVEYIRSQIVEQPVEAAPLTVIAARAVAAVRAERKGLPRDEVERAALRAQGDAVFLFCLVVVLNGQALEVARFKGVCAAAVFFWMGALLGGPHGPPESEEDARERVAAWRSWRKAVDLLSTEVRVETEARAELERRYLAGHPVLFPDGATAWAGHVELVERLLGLAEVIEPARRPKRPSGGEPIAAQVEALATRLADDARVKGYELLGERERAVSIMERRLRA